MAADTRSIEWPGVALDAEFAGRRLTLSRARILAFSGGPLDAEGWPERNLHTDVDKAREAGLDAIIASGTQSEGLLIGLLLELFGADWYAGGELDVRFLQPVRIGDTVTPVVRLTERIVVDGGMRLTLACRCETRPGRSVIEGTASVTLRGSILGEHL
jgi:3-hydroxybutyryl-CoA dehydratase